MTDIVEVIKIRVDSLQHNRQLAAVLTGGLTGIYAIVGAFSASQGIFSEMSALALGPWLAWVLLLVLLILTLVSTDVSFILSVFLLTDSIHQYSKILEYRQEYFFGGNEDKARLAHRRALASDDLSYFYARMGTFTLVFNLLLAGLAVIICSMRPVPLYVAIIGALICGVAAFSLVLGCYRASHYEVPEYPLGKAISRFWHYRGWRAAAQSSVESKSKEATTGSRPECL